MDSDAELTGLAAEILRDAVQVYNRSDIARWAAGHRGELGLGAVTGVFPAVTGDFAAVTSSSPAVTGSFPAITGAFRAVGSGQVPNAQVSLKKVFRLPRKLPAVRLPPSAELAALARSAPLMAVLEALARWLGRDGRLVTKEDELSDADAADAVQWLGVQPQYLPYLWDYALTSGWVELDDEPGSGRRRAVIGQTAWRWADGDNPGALHVWAPIFAAVLASTLDVATASDPDASRKLEFQGQGVAMAMILFLARRAGLSRAEVGELVMSGAIGDWPSARTRRAWDGWVRGHGDPARWLVGELAGLRAVYMPETDEGAVELTPLALWALREQLRLDGIEIPLLPAVSQRMTAAGLVALADAVSDAEFEAEAASWMAAGGGGPGPRGGGGGGGRGLRQSATEPEGPQAERRGPAAGQDGEVLDAVCLVGDGGGADVRADLPGPQQRAGAGAAGRELAVGGALEQQAAGGGHDALAVGELVGGGDLPGDGVGGGVDGVEQAAAALALGGPDGGLAVGLAGAVGGVQDGGADVEQAGGLVEGHR
jgi:hypothetical protein